MVELMVGLLIGLLLLAGVVEIYLSSKQSYRVTEAGSRVQENGRFAIDVMAYDLRMAGVFWACPEPLGQVYSHLNPAPGAINFGANAISGAEGVGLNGSDTVTFLNAPDNPLGLAVPMAAADDALQLSPGNGVAQGDVMVITDCMDSDQFQVTNADADTTGTVEHATGLGVSPGNADDDLTKLYQTDSWLLHPQQASYSVQNGPSGQPTLFRNGEAKAEGIENLQVSYGVDSDRDDTVDRYVNADQVPDWSLVVSVRVSLVARSLDDFVTLQPQSYSFWGGDVVPADRRLRRVFTKLITLRNRLP